MASPAPLTLLDIAERYNISDTCLDGECSDEHIDEFSKYCVEWEQVANHLKLKETTVSDLRSIPNGDLRRSKLLRQWKSQFAFKATYKVLVQALVDVGRGDHACSICETLSTVVGGVACNGVQEGVAKSKEEEEEEEGARDNRKEIAVIKDRIKHLESLFSNLITEVLAIGEKHTVMDIQSCLVTLPGHIYQQYHKLIEELEDKFSNSDQPGRKYLMKLFSFKKYCDFINPYLLEHLVKRLGDEELKSTVALYLEKLEHFSTTTRLIDFTCWVGYTVDSSELKSLRIHFGNQWKDCTLKDLNDFRIECSYKQWFGQCCMPNLAKVDEGSLVVTFSVLSSFSLESSPEEVNMQEDFFKSHNVIMVEIDGKVVYKEEDNIIHDMNRKLLNRDPQMSLPNEVQFRFRTSQPMPISSNIEIEDGGMVARSVGYCNGVVYGSKSLKGTTEFKVKLLDIDAASYISIAIGVFRANINQLGPMNITSSSIHSPNFFMWFCDKIYHSGNHGEYGKVNLCKLVKGDTVAMKLTSTGLLYFYINGESQGLASKIYRRDYTLLPVLDLGFAKGCKVRITKSGWQTF